jgi:hypothetical protein
MFSVVTVSKSQETIVPIAEFQRQRLYTVFN